MPDLMIRNVPDDVLAAIDERARRVGLSRSAYIRRALIHEVATTTNRVMADNQSRLVDLAADLPDEQSSCALSTALLATSSVAVAGEDSVGVV